MGWEILHHADVSAAGGGSFHKELVHNREGHHEATAGVAFDILWGERVGDVLELEALTFVAHFDGESTAVPVE